MKLESQNQSFFTNIANGINQYIIMEPYSYESMSEHYKKFVLKPLLANIKEKYIVLYTNKAPWYSNNVNEFISVATKDFSYKELEIRNWIS